LVFLFAGIINWRLLFTVSPQKQLALCKTCEKQKFFFRNFNAINKLYEVEKNFRKIGLICFVTDQ